MSIMWCRVLSGFSREPTPVTMMVHAASAFQMNQECSLTVLQTRIGGGGGKRGRGNGDRVRNTHTDRDRDIGRGRKGVSSVPLSSSRLASPHMEAYSALSDTEVEVKDRLSTKLWDWSGNRSRKPQASRVSNMA